MWLVWVGVALMTLHFAGVGPFATMDYWWMLPFGLAFLWFEFVERPLGLDKKKGHDEVERVRKRRIMSALGDKAPSVERKAKGRR
jgi:small Trp-rich protein